MTDDTVRRKSDIIPPAPSDHPDSRMSLTLTDMGQFYNPPQQFNPEPPALIVNTAHIKDLEGGLSTVP